MRWRYRDVLHVRTDRVWQDPHHVRHPGESAPPPPSQRPTSNTRMRVSMSITVVLRRDPVSLCHQASVARDIFTAGGGQVYLAYFELMGKRCYDLLDEARREALASLLSVDLACF